METVTANQHRPQVGPGGVTANQYRSPVGPGIVAGKLMSTAVFAAGSYAQRARTTWTLWLRNAENPPHEDL